MLELHAVDTNGIDEFVIRSTMRLKKSRTTAEEELISVINEGYRILNVIHQDYRQKTENKTFTPQMDNHWYEIGIRDWRSQAVNVLNSTFPTGLEANSFVHTPPRPLTGLFNGSVDEKYFNLTQRLDELISALKQIRDTDLGRYTDLPLATRLYVEDIDSFRNVKDVNPDLVASYLKDGSYLDLSEDAIQRGLEQILREPFHKKDWGGEENDLYTSNVWVQGRRVATAFLLKGNGLKKPKMEIKDCGANGDQLIRLFQSPAQLFIVQFVGEVSESVTKDVQDKVDL